MGWLNPITSFHPVPVNSARKSFCANRRKFIFLQKGRQKAKGKNLKKRAEICGYLQENQIVKPEELGGVIEEKRNAVSSIKAQMDKKAGRMKELQEIYDMAVTYKKYEPIYKNQRPYFFRSKKEIPDGT